MKHTTKLFTLFTLVVLSTMVFVPSAYAFDGRGDDRIFIGKDEVINEDLYLGGNDILVEGTINGDLMAAGENVVINGVVTGDLFVGGSTVTVNGSVGDDLFSAGASVTLGPDANIADDVFLAGGSIEAREGSTVGGTFLMGAAQGLLSGSIAEDLWAGASRLRLEGVIDGQANVHVESEDDGYIPSFDVNGRSIRLPSIPGGLSFGDEAAIAGSLKVTSPESPSVPASVTTDVTHSLPTYDAQLAREFRRERIVTSPLLNDIRRLVGLLLVGSLIGLLFPGWLRRLSGTLESKPLPSLGLGLLNFVAAPFILFTLIGLVLLLVIVFAALSLGNMAVLTFFTGMLFTSVASMAYILTIAYLCQAVIAYLSGRWILRKFQPEWEGNLMWPLLLGLLIFGLLFAIPVGGGLLQLLVIFAGLGAILVSLWDNRQTTAPAVVEAPALEG